MQAYPTPNTHVMIQEAETPICETQRQEEPLPHFSHLPPPHIQGRRRWPISLEAQGFPTTKKPVLIDILIWVSPYLEPTENAKLHEVSTDYRYGPTFGPLWFYRPWSPHRRQRWGFRIPNRNRTVVNDTPPPHLPLHFIWQFLTTSERYKMTKLAAP
jgi:hypothetical protein